MSTTTTTPSTPSAQTAGETLAYRVPENQTLSHAAKLAIVEDKPIILDYWNNSIDGTAYIGVRPTGEKMLVKSEEEYTSSVAKIYKVGGEYIIMTENSIYIVDGGIQPRKLKA